MAAGFGKAFMGGLSGALSPGAIGGAIGSGGLSMLGGLAIGGLTSLLDDTEERQKEAEKKRRQLIFKAGQRIDDAAILSKANVGRVQKAQGASASQSLIDRGLYNTTVKDAVDTQIADSALARMNEIDSRAASQKAGLDLTFAPVAEPTDLGVLSSMAASLGRAAFSGQSRPNLGQDDQDIQKTPAGNRGALMDLYRNAEDVGARTLTSMSGLAAPVTGAAMRRGRTRLSELYR